MARADNPYTVYLGALPLALLLLGPLASSIVLLMPGAVDATAFADLFDHPQFARSLALSLFTGIMSTALALMLSLLVIRALGTRALKGAGLYLALPHLALAIGLGLLIAPTGLLARFIAAVFTAWTSPPPWVTTQDPHGFALIAALVLKEVPFLVWAMASVLNQPELRERFQREVSVARSLGHGPASGFARVIAPQLLQRCLWPLVAVFTYGLTVVDMALVIGPTQPPTLAQLIWVDLNDGDISSNARGAAGTLFLSFVAALIMILTTAFSNVMRPATRQWMTKAAKSERRPRRIGARVWRLWLVVYLLVIGSLLLQSVSGFWPFPRIVTDSFSVMAWQRVLLDLTPTLNSLTLAFTTSVAALLATVIWLETRAERQDRVILSAALFVLCFPALLIALGNYRLLLQLGWTGTWQGLFLVHVLPVAAYIFVVLQGPYRAYDARWQAAAQGLQAGRLAFLLHVKWPMLKANLWSAWAIGFAVSLAQYVNAQLAAAGRFSTLPMEAVTLTSGGNRALLAAYGLLLMLLPLAGFTIAATAGQSRWKIV
jgi:putative thiamine transport system permease protein